MSNFQLKCPFLCPIQSELSGFCQDEGQAIAFCLSVELERNLYHFSNSSHPVLIFATTSFLFLPFQKYLGPLKTLQCRSDWFYIFSPLLAYDSTFLTCLVHFYLSVCFPASKILLLLPALLFSLSYFPYPVYVLKQNKTKQTLDCSFTGVFGGHKIRCKCSFCHFNLEVSVFKMAIHGVFEGHK